MRSYKKLMLSLITLSVSTMTLSSAFAETSEQRLQRLETELNDLRGQLEATADAVENTSVSSGLNISSERSHFGGYGELHYNNLENDDGSKKKKELDFHRFVLEFGHDFSHKTRFQSELEFEHFGALENGEGSGEVELEQAYIEHDFTKSTSAKAGLMLVPVGILNDTHEPPTFYGVERNLVEKNIIPSTWWGAGVGVSGHFPNGLSYDAMIHEGLNMPDSFKIRSGRQKGGKAKADDLAFTGRLKYSGISGLELAVTGHHETDFAQGAVYGGSANLVETHAVYNKGRFGAKALYARWDLDGASARAANKDVQDGAYVEGSFKVTSKLGTFVRYSQWDNGGVGDTEVSQTDVGANFWLDKHVILKADYQNQDAADNSKAFDGFNLGVGYQF